MEEKLKYQIFNLVTEDNFALQNFTRKVNSFLSENEIVDIQKTIVNNRIDNWAQSGVIVSYSYVITYKQRSKP